MYSKKYGRVQLVEIIYLDGGNQYIFSVDQGIFQISADNDADLFVLFHERSEYEEIINGDYSWLERTLFRYKMRIRYVEKDIFDMLTEPRLTEAKKDRMMSDIIEMILPEDQRIDDLDDLIVDKESVVGVGASVCQEVESVLENAVKGDEEPDYEYLDLNGSEVPVSVISSCPQDKIKEILTDPLVKVDKKEDRKKKMSLRMLVAVYMNYVGKYGKRVSRTLYKLAYMFVRHVGYNVDRDGFVVVGTNNFFVSQKEVDIDKCFYEWATFNLMLFSRERIRRETFFTTLELRAFARTMQRYYMYDESRLWILREEEVRDVKGALLKKVGLPGLYLEGDEIKYTFFFEKCIVYMIEMSTLFSSLLCRHAYGNAWIEDNIFITQHSYRVYERRRLLESSLGDISGLKKVFYRDKNFLKMRMEKRHVFVFDAGD